MFYYLLVVFPVLDQLIDWTRKLWLFIIYVQYILTVYSV